MPQHHTIGLPLESEIVANVLRYLRSLPETWAQKIHGNIYGDVGTPDILGVSHGTAFAFEVKRPGERATKVQTIMLAKWRSAGAITGVVRSVDEAKQLLEGEASNAAER